MRPSAASAFPAAFSMRRFGRRNGFAGGALIGVVGGLVGTLAILHGSFALLCLATFLCGSYQAFVVQYRFAAADTATPVPREATGREHCGNRDGPDAEPRRALLR